MIVNEIITTWQFNDVELIFNATFKLVLALRGKFKINLWTLKVAFALHLTQQIGVRPSTPAAAQVSCSTFFKMTQEQFLI